MLDMNDEVSELDVYFEEILTTETREGKTYRVSRIQGNSLFEESPFLEDFSELHSFRFGGLEPVNKN